VTDRVGGDCYEPDGGALQGWVLDNIFTIARREIVRLELKENPNLTTLDRWRHVLRLCEKVGCKGRGVLRDNGGELVSRDAPK
jgi:hypothetical protein